MKKVIAFIGTPRRKATYQATKEFEAYLKRLMNVEFEYVFLSDYNLEYCRGCKLCFNKGEELCPLKDDRDALLEKMADSDGVIFATPNYAFHVSALMKNLLDRTSFLLHRPRFFGKPCTAIVSQGFRGGDTIRKYLEDCGEIMGFYAVKGSSVTTLDPMTEGQRTKLSQEMRKAAERFSRALLRPAPPSPSLFRLMVFRTSRTVVRSLNETYLDYHYYKDRGWFESSYYYQASLGPVKRLMGGLFDLLGKRMATQA